jgi:hypothetical protein
MPSPTGFSYETRGSEVVVFHHGRRATRLKGNAAQRFLRDVERGDPQEAMARVTGNYKRRNERMGKEHPRNRG